MRGSGLDGGAIRADNRRGMQPPLLDPGLAEQVFHATEEHDRADLRSIVADFEREISSRLTALQGECAGLRLTAADVQREVHGLRGVVANFGLARAAERLRSLEDDWTKLDQGGRMRLLLRAGSALQAGLAELRERYPYLRT